MAGKEGDLAPELKTLFLAPEDDDIDLFFFQGLSVRRNDLQNKIFALQSSLSFLAAKMSLAAAPVSALAFFNASSIVPTM